VALLLAGQIFELSHIGRLVSGLIAPLWGDTLSGFHWTPDKAALIVRATLCFFTVESLNAVNAVTRGGIPAAQLPLSIYPKWMRYLFTCGIPLACMNYLPADVLLNRSPSPVLAWLAPLVGFAFLALSLPIFQLGIRKYTSAGG
jgi:ABC-2 type transport system permease protein